METLSFEIIINAPKQKIWDILWEPETYSEWTQFFGQGSVMKSDWKVGGKTYFLNADGEGMISTIDCLDMPDQVIFKHLGTVNKDGEEDTESMEVKQWKGTYEKYILIDYGDRTKLHAEIQTEKSFREHMNSSFEKGLQTVKNLAEVPG